MDLGEEARIQQEARDLGIAAAERGDVEAFEQPDLFAAEQEQKSGDLVQQNYVVQISLWMCRKTRNQNPPNQKKSS